MYINEGLMKKGTCFLLLSVPLINADGPAKCIDMEKGIRYMMSQDRHLIFSYRYHHISNGGSRSPDESIDSNFFIIGIATALPVKNGGAFQNPSNYISIILPNTIHKCKKEI